MHVVVSATIVQGALSHIILRAKFRRLYNLELTYTAPYFYVCNISRFSNFCYDHKAAKLLLMSLMAKHGHQSQEIK